MFSTQVSSQDTEQHTNEKFFTAQMYATQDENKTKKEGGWSALSKEHSLKKTVNDIHLSLRSNMCSDDDTYAEHVHTHCQNVKHILQ